MVTAVSERCTLVRVFAEFEMLPDLLALAPGAPPGARGAAPDDAVLFVATDVTQSLEGWTNLLAGTGANMDHVVDGDLPDGVSEGLLLAQDAWGLAERLQLLLPQGRTLAGDRLARLAEERPWAQRSAADHQAVVSTVSDAVREHYVGADGLPVVPLLHEAARRLAETDHAWARHCPGLFLVEFEALIYWAFEDPDYARRLCDRLEIHRDVAMHRYGVPPPDDGDPDDIQIVHEAETMRLYVETEELAARTDLTITEVRATAMLFVFAELLGEPLLTASTYLTLPANGDAGA